MAYDPLAKHLREKARVETAKKIEAARLETIAEMKATIPYSREMAAEICDMIANGDVLKDVCQLEHTPTLKIVRRWLRERPEFAQAMREAETDRLRSWEDEMVQVTRDDTRDHTMKDDGHSWVAVPNSAAVSRAKLQCETLARRLRAEWPEKYGDALTLKPPEQSFGEQVATMPLGGIERMAESARAIEHDAEICKMLDARTALKLLNRDRLKRGEAPLSLAEFMHRGATP
jgi:hypothetical protein